jgi:hypothetical protein
VVVNRCWLCETEGESVDHLHLHYATARGLWNAFFARFGLCWVMPRSVQEFFFFLISQNFIKSAKGRNP